MEVEIGEFMAATENPARERRRVLIDEAKGDVARYGFQVSGGRLYRVPVFPSSGKREGGDGHTNRVG